MPVVALLCVKFVRDPFELYIRRALGVCGLAATVAILAQGTLWAAAISQVFLADPLCACLLHRKICRELPPLLRKPAGTCGLPFVAHANIFADGHTVSNAPDLFRPPKLSGTGPGQYWGGGPPGKPLGCCQLLLLLLLHSS